MSIVPSLVYICLPGTEHSTHYSVQGKPNVGHLGSYDGDDRDGQVVRSPEALYNGYRKRHRAFGDLDRVIDKGGVVLNQAFSLLKAALIEYENRGFKRRKHTENET